MSEEDKIDPKKIFAAFEEQLEPPENYRISRLKLTQYRKTQEESLDDFTNRCKLQALKCDFVDDELNERLIELIISSTPIVDFQKELLNKPKGMKLHEALALGRSIHHQLVAIPAGPPYIIYSSTTNRGHHMQLQQHHCRINSYQHSFVPSVVNLWNQLPSDTVGVASLNLFQNRLTSLTLR